MITRSKLADQLREHQIRSHRATWLALTTFSPKPYIATRFWIITMAKSQILDHHHGKISVVLLSMHDACLMKLSRRFRSRSRC
ncbi:uncharacterized protein LOC109720375 isoform X3 [Ananas comosus]|uniref:Uncharacterized protein LOC109720375 isoform X3 n=1 Tax=Ananas comosus TaxID=4615 RepID=A0A6P5G369_ANACO|nr:uncharacterized protein LOC109720375 isoform X3 [Ananas comosus]